ncbi:MAG: glycosyltransferase family 2 protein [Pirellulales bacterium]|nr:glycosyltransferase family 2 protein [Pirellulales bacterium]
MSSAVVLSKVPLERRRRDVSRPLVSVVVPVFNEEACLPALHRRLTEVLSTLDDSYEILFVNDGSRDRSLEIMRQLQLIDPHVGYHSFTRNFGHESASTCGLLEAQGQTVVIIDADLQDPPELIAQLLERWREGYDLVYAQRRSRQGETWLTRSTSHAFYRLLNRVTRVDMPVDTGDFRLMDRTVVEAFRRLPERNRFVRGMIAWTGFRKSAVYYDRDARLAGETKYNFTKRLGLALDAICGFSTLPLRWITYAGGITAGVAGALFAMALLVGLFSSVGAAGWIVLAAALTLLAGVQLLTVGLVGEYVGRILIEVQARPLYLLGESHAPAIRVAGPVLDRIAG